MGRRQAAPLMSVEATSGGSPDGRRSAGARTECSGARGAGGGRCCRGDVVLPPGARQSAARLRHECCSSAATHTSPHAGMYIARDFHNFFRFH
uniref:SFRICE_016065 n=1 Tax=Spodoptera frugiperda TaxID=7108 RepID=A0A2H1WFH9_SPOFR